ncbi:hypothetical protein [Actinoplanes sp. NPDC026619]|uniref:hypothetical protein n=1 Tax=Actinoplanes sp. NPDC026619 TaxID=3155798 RepID=UPI0033DD778F
MTDEQLDRVIRNADPYRAEVIGQLDGAGQTLLEEIMSEPSTRRPLMRRLVTAVAAAAVLTTALGVTAVLRNHQSAPSSDASGSSGASASPSEEPQVSASGAIRYSAMVLQAAEKNPRLLIKESGWKVGNVYDFVEREGSIEFHNGDRRLEMNWYRAEYYDSYYKDRLDVSKPKPATVDGLPGFLFTYSYGDWAIQLKPNGDSFVELRSSGTWTQAQFDRTVSTIKQVDVQTWLAAMPPEVVTADRADAAADKILADVPLPPNFDRAKVAALGTNSPYHFGALVTGLVGCGWIAEWERARKAGDQAAVRKAADAMKSSHHWKVLNDMNDGGDWPEAFWEVSDKIAAGKDPVGYQDWLGCSR